MPTAADTMAVTVDGTISSTVTFGTDTTAAQVLNDINGQLVGAHAFYDTTNGNKLTIASNTTGVNSSVDITAMTAASKGALGLTGAVGNTYSGAAGSASLQDIASQIQTQLGGAGVASVTAVGTSLTIASVAKGAAQFFKITATADGGALLGITPSNVTTYGGTSSTVADIVNNLNDQFAASNQWVAAGLQASISGGNSVNIMSTNGTQFRVNGLAAGGGNVGFGITGITFTGATPSSSGSAMSTLDAYGISNSAVLAFTPLLYGNDKQAITLSATDSSGALETQTITLQNNAGANTAGNSIDSAIAYINQQLQQSTTTPALQHIVAVKQLVAGAPNTEAINFVSSLSGFTVGVAGTANADGVHAGVATTVTATQYGSGANMAIDTQLGAEAAVTAVGAAVATLGSAQAAVGKGENQLAYGINLAQSQVTNLAAAESNIRDANVAQQAANLTKAQVLQQASIAAMAQANSAPQAVLALLRT
jgi:flagellin